VKDGENKWEGLGKAQPRLGLGFKKSSMNNTNVVGLRGKYFITVYR